MAHISSNIISATDFHQAIIQAKNDHDLIEVMKKYISSMGGFGNAPKELYMKLFH
jgi:hypothetical protein